MRFSNLTLSVLLGAGLLVACSDDAHDLGGTDGGATGGSAGTSGSGGSSGSSGSAGHAGSSGSAGSGGSTSACEQAGGTVSDAECCTSTPDFPNTCLVGACGCGPGSTHTVKVCQCPASTCWDGSDCVGSGTGGAGGSAGSGGNAGSAGTGGGGGVASSCVASGGKITSGLCCAGGGDFPNSCSTGACGCSPSNSKTVQKCECPQGKCFDGSQCI
ncbi:MAG: hypothetical protein R3B13_04665 [Polyangiaceae bacterium]